MVVLIVLVLVMKVVVVVMEVVVLVMEVLRSVPFSNVVLFAMAVPTTKPAQKINIMF